MPDCPIIDAHFHIWDPRRNAMSWQTPGSPMTRPFDIAAYGRAMAGIDLAGAVFVECFVDRGGYLAEVAMAEAAAETDPRVQAIVAQAALDDGADAGPLLERLATRHPMVRGIRRMIEEQPDPDFARRPAFVEGVQLLRDHALSFDVNIHHGQMAQAADLAEAVDGVPLILDHCGKPGIRARVTEPWRTHLARFAANPDTYCKLSGLPVEAEHANWTHDDLRPYLDAVVEAFGFDRLIFATDWPVCTQATTPQGWIALLDRHFSGVAPADLRKVFAGNARRVYRLPGAAAGAS
ncbi:amidohydrolase family protein [Fluviibacterium sp. DFM31]|uniref:Amidohydrolase family protein n=1 Tax=Meridianimarinicoccus marinus TaxID=3231483 RepID=A0ABV3L6X7_9RHOB